MVRYVGDEVAIVAGENEDCVDKALKLIKVDYEIKEPVLDFRKALDNPIKVHEEDNFRTLCDVGTDQKRNLCAHGESVYGDVEDVLKNSAVVLERTYHTKANAQAMMETFRAFSYIDTYGRLNVVSSTQIPFHVRRILSNALDIPKSKIRVIKPRIGGGFGAKQTACCEIFNAFVTWKLKRPAKVIYTRNETFMASNSRHEMQMKVRLGATKDGIDSGNRSLYIIQYRSLWRTWPYDGWAFQDISLYRLYNHCLASRFVYDVVYTNTMQAGAYRGYGATQGLFAVESIVNELADELHMDPAELRLKNVVHEGETLSSILQ